MILEKPCLLPIICKIALLIEGWQVPRANRISIDAEVRLVHGVGGGCLCFSFELCHEDISGTIVTDVAEITHPTWCHCSS